MSQEQSDESTGGRSGQGQISEGGSGTANVDASLGGADAVPDTPDVNDTGEGNAVDTSEQGDETERRDIPADRDTPAGGADGAE